MIHDLYRRAGGAEVYLFNLFEALEVGSHTIVVVYGVKTEFNDGVKKRICYFVDFRQPLKLIRNAVADIIKKESPDIIHVHNLTPAERIYSHISELCGLIPAVQSVHNHILYCPSGQKYFYNGPCICQRKYGLYCLLNMLLNRCFDSKRPWVSFNFYNRPKQFLKNYYIFKKIIVGSEFVKTCLIEHGLKKENIEVLPYFTELPELEESQDENMILFAARIYKEKGLEYLIRAVQYINVPFKLLVVGEGREVDNCKKLACKMGLEDKVEFVDWEFNSGEYCRKASVVVVPSIWPEPFGIVGIKAMSYAKPVVAFNVGGIPEWLEDGVTGFLITPYNVKEMAEKISYLLGHFHIAYKMGREGRKRVEQEFNKEKHITRLLDIYKEVIDARV